MSREAYALTSHQGLQPEQDLRSHCCPLRALRSEVDVSSSYSHLHRTAGAVLKLRPLDQQQPPPPGLSQPPALILSGDPRVGAGTGLQVMLVYTELSSPGSLVVLPARSLARGRGPLAQVVRLFL